MIERCGLIEEDGVRRMDDGEEPAIRQTVTDMLLVRSGR